MAVYRVRKGISEMNKEQARKLAAMLKLDIDIWLEDAERNSGEDIETNEWLAQLNDVAKAAYGDAWSPAMLHPLYDRYKNKAILG